MKPLDRRLRSLRNAAQAALARHERDLAIAALAGRDSLILARRRVLMHLGRVVLAYLPVGSMLWLKQTTRGLAARRERWTRRCFLGVTAATDPSRFGAFAILVPPGTKTFVHEWHYMLVGDFLNELCDGTVVAEERLRERRRVFGHIVRRHVREEEP